MVLSTLHTNAAIGAVTALFALNIDPSLIATCLSGVVSQRLVRKICPHCKEEYVPPKEILQEFFDVPPPDAHWFRGKKCARCNFTGYNGRIAIAELWVPNEKDTILINKKVDMHELRESAYKSTILMAEDAMEKLQAGLTNLEELIRCMPYSGIYSFRRLANLSGNSGG